MRHLAAGLQNLREHNVVHRDLKPENLLLSGSVESGFTLKIADFGMARTLESAQQLANTMCGSPAFMAPEVFLMRQRGEPGYDDKADLWSVGCILYFMLTKNMVTPAQNHVHLAQELQVREIIRRPCLRARLVLCSPVPGMHRVEAQSSSIAVSGRQRCH